MSLAARGPASPAAARTGAVAVEATAAAEPAPGEYVGLVTRAIAFGLDAALINAVAIVTAAIVALTFSIVTVPDELEAIAAVAGGAVYLLWTTGYFVTFWSTTGQTPGSRAMRIRVEAATGGPLRPRRALLRFLGLTLAALPLFAGFLLILVDDRRRGLHDRLARTVVLEAEEEAGARSPARGGRPRA